MLKIVKTKGNKKEPKQVKYSQQIPSPPLLMHKLESPSPPRMQKKPKGKTLKTDLQKQTDEFLGNHCSKLAEISPLAKYSRPSSSILENHTSFSASSSPNSMPLSQVQSQIKAAELRSKIADMEEQLQNLYEAPQELLTNDEVENQICNNIEDAENNAEENTDDNMEVFTENQLFGKNFKGDEMVLLSNEIYCKKRILSMAEGCSYKASHVSRRLLEGVYKKEALVKYTFTGKSPKQIHCGCLDRNARIAIVEHSMDIGSKRGWQPQSVYDLNRAMSQKVSELKRMYNRI